MMDILNLESFKEKESYCFLIKIYTKGPLRMAILMVTDSLIGQMEIVIKAIILRERSMVMEC